MIFCFSLFTINTIYYLLGLCLLLSYMDLFRIASRIASSRVIKFTPGPNGWKIFRLSDEGKYVEIDIGEMLSVGDFIFDDDFSSIGIENFSWFSECFKANGVLNRKRNMGWSEDTVVQYLASGGIDFNDFHVSNADFSNMNFEDAIFSNSTITDSIFDHSVFHCEIVNSSFSGSSLIGCQFLLSGIKNLDLSNSVLTNIYFENTNIDFIDFSGSSIKSCDFSGVDFSSCDFSGTDIISSIFEDSNLVSCDFSDSKIVDTSFYDAMRSTADGNIPGFIIDFDHSPFERVEGEAPPDYLVGLLRPEE